MLKLFSGKKKTVQSLISELLSELLEKGELSLSFQVEKTGEDAFKLDIFGEDEGLLKTKKGKLLLAFQTYILQALYKEFPDKKLRLLVDSNGFWKEQDDRLLSLTDRLIERALETNRPVFFKRTLSPYQRRLIHEKVSGNTGVRSQSFGSGPFKNLKLIPDSFKSDER